MKPAPKFGKKVSPLPAPATPRAIAESTVREWTGQGPIPAAALATVERLARG